MYIFSRNSKQSVDFLWVYGKFHSFSPEYALSQFLDVGILSLTVLEYNLSPSLPQICNWCVIQHKFQDSTRVVHAISRLLPLVGNRSDALFIVIGIWFGHCRIFFFTFLCWEINIRLLFMHVTNATTMSCAIPTACQNKHSIKKAAYFSVGHCLRIMKQATSNAGLNSSLIDEWCCMCVLGSRAFPESLFMGTRLTSLNLLKISLMH